MADPVTELLPHFFGGGGFCSAAVPVPKPGSPFWQKAIILLLIPGDSFSQNVGLNKYPSNKMLPNAQVFTFDIDFNYILALWTSTNWSMLFLGFDISAFQYPELYLSGYWTSETPSTPLYIHTSGIKQ